MRKKRKRIKKPPDKKHLKIGDTVSVKLKRRPHYFCKVVAISKNWKYVSVKWHDGLVYDIPIKDITTSNLYTEFQHKLLLGVTP
jgi:hypothetical protein